MTLIPLAVLLVSSAVFSFQEESPALRAGPITQKERAFWSFQPLRDPAPPQVKNPARVNNGIDRFVLSRLETAGLQQAPLADKRTLLRRATFGLTGLPPTPEQAEAFLADDSPMAFEKLIERLLASHSYGEHWGRRWLDVVRYADTAGETADFPIPEAYLYRNWVIDAFNQDKPYDQFLQEQLAGDILAQEVARNAGGALSEKQTEQFERLVQATGFIAISRRFGFDPENYHDLTIQDTLDTLGQTVLGLSLGCCHCHDHKYDPVNRDDYYGWFGVFESTRYPYPGSESSKKQRDFAPAIPPGEIQRRENERTASLEKINGQLKRLQEEKAKLESKQPNTEKNGGNASKPADIAAKMNSLLAQKNELSQVSLFPLAYGVTEDKGQNAKIRQRGEAKNFGKEAPRRNLAILGGEPLAAQAGSGRLQLANWLTRKENPLTARVMVNRIWQGHFGRGLVETANDFGARGMHPSHPELLDWLASRFIASGWSVKAMHRLIMNSTAYQIGGGNAQANPSGADPENKLLQRYNSRRLTAEEIRDALLAVSGDLDPSPGGPHPFPKPAQWGFTQHNPFQALYETKQRSVYLMQPRLKRHPFLALFDGADPNSSTAGRTTTTVPTQALFFMNDPFVFERAQSLGRKMIAASQDEPARISKGFFLALSRAPVEAEISSAKEYLAAYRENLPAALPPQQRELAAFTSFARSLLTRNEFLFLD